MPKFQQKLLFSNESIEARRALEYSEYFVRFIFVPPYVCKAYS